MSVRDWIRNLISGPSHIQAGGAEGDADLSEEMPVAAQEAAGAAQDEWALRLRGPAESIQPADIGAFEDAETAHFETER